MTLRSNRWFRRDDEVGLEHRAAMRAAGHPVDVAPEAAVGGPLAAVRDGDMITIDVAHGELTIELADEEIAQRLRGWRKPVSRHLRGWPALYQQHVLPAPQGADLDFLRPTSTEEIEFLEPVVGRS